MRLVTLNTWKNTEPYDDRLSAMTGLLAGAAADLILLQEAFIGGVIDTAAHLGLALDMHVHAAPARAKPRLNGGIMVDSTNGLAILSPWAADEEAIVELPSDPRDPGRIAQVARFGGLIVVNLHLTHLDDGDDLRRAQARHLVEALPEGIATVIGGDFNAEPQSSTLDLLKAAGFRDLAERNPFATCGQRRIDFLMTRDLAVIDVAVEPVGDREIDGIHASDHAGVLAEVQAAED